jgi:hypothetical protein
MVRKAEDRLISALETTMSGLTFSTHEESGLVQIADENGEFPSSIEPTSILDLTPPPTPTRADGDAKRGTANYLPMEILCLILKFVPPGRQDVFAATSRVSRLWYHASTPFL